MRWRVSGFESDDGSDDAMFLMAVVLILGGDGGLVWAVGSVGW